MIITPQLIFFIAGIAALVVAAILFVIAMTYYSRQDIRGVKNDLAGKARQGQRGASTVRRTTRSTRASRNTQRSVVDDARRGNVYEPTGGMSQQPEDDMDTILDTRLRQVPQGMGGVSSYNQSINDDIPTVVTFLGDYHNGEVSKQSENDANAPTLVEENEEDLPTQVDQANAVDASSFVVTKSILAIHSNEIITAG